MSSEPTGLIASSGIELLTMGTPNGVKASVLLEELKAAYGTEYTFQAINIMKNTQKEPWYTALCPNGRIPTIVDHNRGGFAVFEGIAILLYLARHYDPQHKFGFPVDSDEYSEVEQWIGWQHGGLGPMQGQANHFVRFAKTKPPYAVQRYVGETERLYGILDARLSSRKYVVGDRYSIADMSLVGWVNMSTLAGIDLAAQFPNVQAWLDRLLERPAVRKGLAVPNESTMSNAAIAKKIAEGDEDTIKADQAARKLIADAKAEFGYKYASP
ncbi:glutathione S-transferase II [Coniochaeta ligniaria NRRL 30616]|uniref:Glutathione S-transferase II n=1 Tax=Coniochaeta ligniaria NRRL 30616 TaxID=1408157 RepID=A0A1J7J676_9PEZI|nr:glutathione S-transferase II [Coniochaeta ligniaria NRRL 30616]